MSRKWKETDLGQVFGQGKALCLERGAQRRALAADGGHRFVDGAQRAAQPKRRVVHVIVAVEAHRHHATIRWHPIKNTIGEYFSDPDDWGLVIRNNGHKYPTIMNKGAHFQVLGFPDFSLFTFLSLTRNRTPLRVQMKFLVSQLSVDLILSLRMSKTFNYPRDWKLDEAPATGACQSEDAKGWPAQEGSDGEEPAVAGEAAAAFQLRIAAARQQVSEQHQQRQQQPGGRHRRRKAQRLQVQVTFRLEARFHQVERDIDVRQPVEEAHHLFGHVVCVHFFGANGDSLNTGSISSITDPAFRSNSLFTCLNHQNFYLS